MLSRICGAMSMARPQAQAGFPDIGLQSPTLSMRESAHLENYCYSMLVDYACQHRELSST